MARYELKKVRTYRYFDQIRPYNRDEDYITWLDMKKQIRC